MFKNHYLVESEFEKVADGLSEWKQDELWTMFQRLSLGSGITMGDDHKVGPIQAKS